MRARSLIVPGLVFFAGAVLGRLFGIAPLVRGAMTIASISGAMPAATERSQSRRVTHRPARRRPSQRRSAKAA